MSSAPSTREQLERLVALAQRALAYWKRALLVFVVGVAIAVPFVFTRPRSYRSETVILYQETIHSSDVPGGEGNAEGARRVGARLREVLLSRASLEPIITEMNLYADRIVRGELIGAVEEMRKNITFRAREGDTFEIAFTGATPEEAQEGTRRLAESILRDATARRAEQAKTVKEFLDAESGRNEADLKRREADLAAFVALHPEYAARLRGPAAGGTTPKAAPSAGAAGASSDSMLAVLEAQAARIDQKLRALPSASARPQAPQGPLPDSPELVAARRDLADKLARYTDKHPDVIAAKNRVRAAEQAQAAAEAARAAAAQESAASGGAEEAALKKELGDVQAQIAFRRAQLAKSGGAASATAPVAPRPASGASAPSSVELEVEFSRLLREVADARDRQQKLDERLFRASITASSVTNDRNIQVSVLDPAYLPVRPVSKSRTLMLGALLALSGVLSLAVAVVSAMLDDRLYDRADLEQLEILPVLAVIPPARPEDIRALPARSDSS